MTARLDQLDDIVRRFDLNEQPFYRDWRNGTLSVERLAEYAREWAPFIGVVDRGWERIGHPRYAAEEREHDELWQIFRSSLGDGAAGEIQRPQSKTLLAVGEQAFASVPETLGASTALRCSSRRRPRASSPDCASTTPERSAPMGSGTSWSTRSRPTSPRCWPLASRGSPTGSSPEPRRPARFSAAAWGGLDGVYYT